MVKAGFSEFSYGYSVTQEITRNQGSRAAPIFPSLTDEGTSGGYDVEIDMPVSPLFLQFKLSDCMVSRGAREFKNKLLRVPYYRTHLRSKKISKQQELLYDFERAHHDVYYIAPGFHKNNEFNMVYTSGEVISRSVMFRPSQIQYLLDDEEHYVAFQNHNSTYGYFCSQNQEEISIFHWEDLVKLVQKGKRLETLDSFHEFVANIEKTMFEILEEHYRKELRSSFLNLRVKENPVSRVASLGQIFFGCTLFLLK